MLQMFSVQMHHNVASAHNPIENINQPIHSLIHVAGKPPQRKGYWIKNEKEKKK